MNTLTKVLIGAALVVGLAGLVVGLSNSAQIVNIAGNAGNTLGAVASQWTNFGASGVTTKVGYAFTSQDGSTTTLAINGVKTSTSTNAVIYPVSYAVIGGSAGATLVLTTSTTLNGNWDCQYDTVSETTSTAGITLTLPPATSTASVCLVEDGTWEVTEFQLQAGNNFNVTFATSTGDTFAYNATSTAGGLVMSTNTAGSYYELKAWRFSSSSVVYSLGNNGIGH